MQLVEFTRADSDLRCAVNPEYVVLVSETLGKRGTLITVENLHEDIWVEEDYDTVTKLLGSITRVMGAHTIALK